MINAAQTVSRNNIKTNYASRAGQALKTLSAVKAKRLVIDVVKYNFARYLVLDVYGTAQFCWTLKGAMLWLPFCAPASAQVYDMLKMSLVAERQVAAK